MCFGIVGSYLEQKNLSEIGATDPMPSGVLDLTTFSNANIDGLHNNENLLKLLTMCNFDREDIGLPTEACDIGNWY